jgi:putative spermidine/putrescine transport system permease protein
MKQFGQNRTISILVAPALAFLVLLFIMPLTFVLISTLQADSGGFSADRYLAFAQDPVVHTVYLRTFRLAAIVTAIAVVVAYPASYAIAHMKTGRRSLMMSLTILPLMTNPVARTYTWLIILGRLGLVNRTAQFIGLTDKPMRLLYTETAIVLGLLHLFLPLMVLSLVSAMENIRPEVEEAAQSLGANRLITFVRVILPLSADGLILGGTLVFTGCITAYVTPAILGGTRVLTLSTLLYQRAMVLMDWQSATVVAVAMVITTLIVNRILRLFRPRTI